MAVKLKPSELTKRQLKICEDEDSAYEYWKNHFNHNPDDCCNLRM